LQDYSSSLRFSQVQGATNGKFASMFWMRETACYGSKFSLFPDPLGVSTISG
jgi:hypothetical protein